MSDATTAQIQRHKEPDVIEIPLKAAENALQGLAITIDRSGGAGDGYSQVGGDDADTIYVGQSMETRNNTSGSNGTLKSRILTGKLWRFVASGAAQATWGGRAVFLLDNQTVGLDASSTNKVFVGIVDTVESSTKVMVRTMPYGLVDRSRLVENKVQSVSLLPLLRSNAGAALLGAETAGTFNMAVGTNTVTIDTEIAISETETSIGYIHYTLPANYVSGGTLTIAGKIIAQGAGTLGASTIDFSAYKSTGEEAVGGEIVATAAVSLVDDVWTPFAFTITPTTLSAGDEIVIKLTTVVIESAGSAQIGTIDGFVLNMDIRG